MSEGVQASYFFWITCGDRYLSAARSAEALALPPPEYACALVSFLSLIPIAVLRDYEAKFGIVGRLSLKWCEAFHHTCCLFVPDAAQLLWSAGGRYTRATGEAVVAAGERTGDFVVGLYVLLSLLVASAIYLPRVLYGTVEGVLLGWRSVTLVLVVWDVYLEFGV
ncbi:hypothetical protein DVH05_019252 [Phytophthora capsici]|nr:hypothetical protein DVH05_019252 [Phytophthora capsici]